MKNTFGNSVAVTLFGESHGEAVGAVLDGMAPGIEIDEELIARQMRLRRGTDSLSTARREEDKVRFLSGVRAGKTTGTPICMIIANRNQNSADYAVKDGAPMIRPGHADLTGWIKYRGFNDPAGGGHFSGRITAGLVAAGAVALSALKECGVKIGTHILSCAGIKDAGFDPVDPEKQIEELCGKEFAVLDESAGEKMKEAILAAREDLDSVGGVLETAVTGLPAGVGEPWFDTVEGELSHALFSIPAVKGVEFGKGFALADMMGSKANDPFRMKGSMITTETNNCGGILGGITNGMPVIFRTAVKPTPSIYKKQKTVLIDKGEDTEIEIKGRHDPAIVHRARVVQDSVSALVLCDLLSVRYGTDFPFILAKK
ncbi:MAG: chorismate synthase [Clostridia bacterium]|nr:chorismate synthase [Clostridia bacterium]